MSDTTFIQGGIDPVAYQELVEALAASEARERTLQKQIDGLTGNLVNWAVDLQTGKTKESVARELYAAAKRVRTYMASLPDAPSPTAGDAA